jgi:hypothetical protein
MSKKDAYYFSHDANAQDDPKCMQLIDQLQMEGYGIFWALIEKLRSEKEYKLPLSVITSFARRWQTTPEKIKTVISQFGLFVVEDGFFFSARLKNSMELKSEMARKSLSYRKDRTTVERPNNDPNTPDLRKVTIKGKESKEKESKRKKGGVGELLPVGNGNTGIYFDLRENRRTVRLQDDKEQPLGPEQYELAKAGKLNPEDIREGEIH